MLINDPLAHSIFLLSKIRENVVVFTTEWLLFGGVVVAPRSTTPEMIPVTRNSAVRAVRW